MLSILTLSIKITPNNLTILIFIHGIQNRTLRALNQSQRLINIVLNNLVRKPQFRQPLGNSNNTQQRSRRRIRVPLLLRVHTLLSLLNIPLRNKIMQFSLHYRRVIFRQRHIGPNELHVKRLEILLRGLQILVDKSNMPGQQLIRKPVRLIEHYKNQIESRQKCRRQINVLMRGQFPVVSPVERVGRGQNRRSSVQRRYHPHFRDRNRLLLHDLVNRSPVMFAHFVKLVNAANSHVGKDQGPAFQRNFARVRVLHDRRCEPHTRASFSGRVDASGRNMGYVFQKLTFGDSRVSNKRYVDVSSNFHAVLHFQRCSADFRLKITAYP